MEIGGLLEKWGHEASSLPNKRRRSDYTDSFSIRETIRKHSHFVMIDGQRGVYYSESWKPDGNTLYLPVSGGVLANMEKYDQISFEQGCFSIGDAAGRFQHKAHGQVIHCWRYDMQDRKLFIALSYFFTDSQVFQDVLTSLGCV